MTSPSPKTQVPSLVQKKIIPAKRSDVFDAWTKPEIMQQWFFPGTWSAETTIDLTVGGTWKNEMIDDGSGNHNGKKAEAGARYPHFGAYLEIKPPEKLVFTWNSHAVENTRVTIELRDLGESTELTLTHEFFPTEDLRAAHDNGWNGCLSNLINHFSK